MPDFKYVLKLKPKDKDAKQKHDDCLKAVKAAAFEAAIMTEKSKPISETINMESITVPSTYTGPTLTWPISLEFVMVYFLPFHNFYFIYINIL